MPPIEGTQGATGTQSVQHQPQQILPNTQRPAPSPQSSPARDEAQIQAVRHSFEERQAARETLYRDFTVFDTAGGRPQDELVSREGLEEVAFGDGPYTQEQRDAARVLLEDTEFFEGLDVGRPGAVDDDLIHRDAVGAPLTHDVADGEIQDIDFQDATVEFSEEVAGGWRNTSLGGAMDGNTLYLDRVTPEMIKELSPTNLNTLMDHLAQREIDVKVNGVPRSMNGAAAVAGEMWGSGDSVAFAKVFAAAPQPVLEYLNANGTQTLTAENLGLILHEMQASSGATDGYESSELDAVGTLVQRYLEHHAGDDPERVASAMSELMNEVARNVEYTPENAGVVTGTLVAGMLKHFNQIEASDQQRKDAVNTLADILGAGSGALPGPWSAAVGVGIAALKGIYNAADVPRDFSDVASRWEADVRLGWLQDPPPGWGDVEVGTAIDWLDTTILANGLR